MFSFGLVASIDWRLMADLREILRTYPAVRSYLGKVRWVRRGEVLAYAPLQDAGAYSTDAYGFRHGVLDGRQFGLDDALAGVPYAIALGASQTFGFGLGSNADTPPSQLAQQLGLAVLNISFPEGDLRTLHAAALRISRATPKPPSFIACFVGGTASRYCFSRRCDPLFGSPDITSAVPPLEVGSVAEQAAFGDLQSFTRLWLGEIADLAAGLSSALVVSLESSALQKTALTPVEVACRLGEPRTSEEGERYAATRLRYAGMRSSVIAAAAIRSAAFATVDEESLTFIDEFHLTPEAAGLVASAIGRHVDVASRRMP